MQHNWTKAQIADILAKRTAGDTYRAIAQFINRTYGVDVSEEAVRMARRRYGDIDEICDEPAQIALLKTAARAKRSSSQRSKETRLVLNELNNREDILEQLKDLVAGLPAHPKAPVIKRDKKKRNVTAEFMLSDTQVGKSSDDFNLEKCRERLRYYTRTILRDLARNQDHYNIERLILTMLGDIIENARIHGEESLIGCEFTTPEQVRQAAALLWELVIVPLAQLGIPMHVIGITGNHDRENERKTFHDPGRNSLTWIIYNFLKTLSEAAGYKHLTWDIPHGIYTTVTIYGKVYLHEHGDFIKGGNCKDVYVKHIAKRAAQLGQVLAGLRLGHWHESAIYDEGFIIVNGSVCGLDSYADVNAYNTYASQTINYYVDTANRNNPYFYSQVVQLEWNDQ